MDTLMLAMTLRGVERLLIVAAGALAIYLGYRLFLAMPKRDGSSGKIDLPGGVSIFLSRVGPGVFFALFGSIVIALSLHYGVAYSDRLETEAVSGQAASGQALTETVLREYTAVGATGGEAREVSETERVNAVLAVASLNRIAESLSADLESADRVAIDSAVLAAKMSLMRGVWDKANWGTWSAFKVWVNEGEADPPPKPIREAARLFRAGAEQ